MRARKNRKIRKSREETPSPDAAKREKAEIWAICGFLAGVVVALAGFVIIGVMGKPQPGIKLVTIAMWFAFASMNAGTFYSGKLTQKNGRVVILREKSPGEFYLTAITHAVISMGGATFFVGLAFFG